MNEIAIIYVALLDEGTDVVRPAQAEKLGPTTYRLLGHIPETETWQFQPDEVVHCEMRTLEDGDHVLLAARSQPPPVQ
jgi:hypothetical protein